MLTKDLDRSAINLLGVLSFTPLFAIFYLIVGPFLFGSGVGLVAFLVVAWLTWIGVLLMFVIYLLQSTNFLVHQKLIWIAVLVFTGYLSMPVFWWMYFKSPNLSRNSK